MKATLEEMKSSHSYFWVKKKPDVTILSLSVRISQSHITCLDDIDTLHEKKGKKNSETQQSKSLNSNGSCIASRKFFVCLCDALLYNENMYGNLCS